MGSVTSFEDNHTGSADLSFVATKVLCEKPHFMTRYTSLSQICATDTVHEFVNVDCL